MRKAMTVTTITGNIRFTWHSKATGNNEKGDDTHHNHRLHQVHLETSSAQSCNKLWWWFFNWKEHLLSFSRTSHHSSFYCVHMTTNSNEMITIVFQLQAKRHVHVYMYLLNSFSLGNRTIFIIRTYILHSRISDPPDGPHILISLSSQPYITKRTRTFQFIVPRGLKIFTFC